MENNPMTDAALAELDRLHEAAIKGMNWQEVAQFQAMITEQYQPLRQHLTDAESRLAEAEREREAAEALVAGLRGALELLLKCNALGVAIPWGRAVSALAFTPASAEANRDAALVRESRRKEYLLARYDSGT